MAGRLTGSLDGRPVVIEANESGLLLTVASWRAAWALRRTAGSLLPAVRMLRQTRVPLRVQVAGSMAASVLPTPGLVVRWLVPELGGLG